MATITFNQNRKNMLLWLSGENGADTQCITGKTQHSAIDWLRDNGYIEHRSVMGKGCGYQWIVTTKGNEWLDANMPMVDQPQPADDLPFSDLGKEDTQELPIVVVDEPSLSDLVNAALDPDNTSAYEALKAYDLTTVPMWVLEIERNDLASLKWALWSECRKINAGTLQTNPEFIAKQIEVNRAFQVCDILHKEVVNRKAVGFNVEN